MISGGFAQKDLLYRQKHTGSTLKAIATGSMTISKPAKRRRVLFGDLRKSAIRKTGTLTIWIAGIGTGNTNRTLTTCFQSSADTI